MIDNIEFGWAKGVDDERCAKKITVASRMLCGREVGFVPVAGQPEFAPSDLHEECRRLLFGQARQLPLKPGEVRYSVCPACHGEAPVSEGRIGGHGEWRVGSEGEPYQSEIPCVGVNLPVRRRR